MFTRTWIGMTWFSVVGTIINVPMWTFREGLLVSLIIWVCRQTMIPVCSMLRKTRLSIRTLTIGNIISRTTSAINWRIRRLSIFAWWRKSVVKKVRIIRLPIFIKRWCMPIRSPSLLSSGAKKTISITAMLKSKPGLTEKIPTNTWWDRLEKTTSIRWIPLWISRKIWDLSQKD